MNSDPCCPDCGSTRITTGAFPGDKDCADCGLVGHWLAFSVCGGDECNGRMFGGWANCRHGRAGRLAELDKERDALLKEGT